MFFFVFVDWGFELRGSHEKSHQNVFFLALRAQKVVIKTVDVSYGGENGFNQAIELAGETLGSVKLIQVRACVAGRRSCLTD